MAGMKEPWQVGTEADRALSEATGIDRFTLRRLREKFHRQWSELPAEDRTAFGAVHPGARLGLMYYAIRDVLSDRQLCDWVVYSGYTLDDVEDRCWTQSRKPVDADLMTRYSLLFGITREFLRAGLAPIPNRHAAHIWPTSQAK